MNPFLIGIGAMIFFMALWAELDWYKNFRRFYYQDNGGGSLIFVGTGLMTIILGLFMGDLPAYTADPIEIIRHGGHR